MTTLNKYRVLTQHARSAVFIVPFTTRAKSPAAAAAERFAQLGRRARAGATALLVLDEINGEAFVYPVEGAPQLSTVAVSIGGTS